MKNSKQIIILLLPVFLTVLFILKPSSCSADMKSNYQNVPLQSLVGSISKITKKNFTYSQSSGSVPLSLSMPLQKSPELVYQIFLESLKIAGLKAVEVEKDIISIYPIESAVYKTVSGSKDLFVTKVITFKYSKASQISESLQELTSPGGFISSSGDNKLLIYDTKDRIDNIIFVARQLESNSPLLAISETLILNNLLPSEVVPVDGVTVQAYDNLSRLVVSGSPGLVSSFKETVYSLDKSVKTVYVRLLISTMTSEFIQEFNFVPVFQGGALSAGLTSIAMNTLQLPMSDGISVLLSLFDAHTDVTVKAQPFLMLLEGHQASFNVGREIPILVSTIDQDTGQSIRNVQRKKIGLSVDLKAKVRPDGLINLELFQNLSSISQQQLETATDIITDDQSLKTNLLIKPNHVYAVGGLTDERTIDSDVGLPFWDFLDSTKEAKQLQEIMIFIETSLSPFNNKEGLEVL